MARNLTYKILTEHLVFGRLVPGQEIAIRIDQTLTQDATGTMAYLQFEALGLPRVRTELSVSYVDHNLLQASFENADDHRYLQTAAAKYGVYFSKPGNGICHQVHLERLGLPGKTLLGSDSHTLTIGALGSLGIGAGGLDVALAMGGNPFYLPTPRVLLVRLRGRLGPWVTAKDIALELLRRLSVKGGVGKVLEFGGDGVAHLTVSGRATIANMCAELGATSAIFPSDEQTLAYLRLQGRQEGWRPLAPDPEAAYHEVLEIDLETLEPLIAQPSSPDNVVPAREVRKLPVAQVCVGGCCNSSYRDLMSVAAILEGKRVHKDVSLTISPGSRQVYQMIARYGGLAALLSSGARILETACGPCIGMGQVPPTGEASVRSFNRNFLGRSGHPQDRVYLASPEVCAATALLGQITDPRELGHHPKLHEPEAYLVDDSMIIPPVENAEDIEVIKGPNIKPLPDQEPLSCRVQGPVLLLVGDDITTDHILPGGPKVLPLRSNIPAISQFAFAPLDPGFAERSRVAGGGFIVAGANYGQGSSREHAALAPHYLGVKAVIAKSFARIHHANLVNSGILPLTFVDETDYQALGQGDQLQIEGLPQALMDGNVTIKNLTKGTTFQAQHALGERQIAIIANGGSLNYFHQGGR